MRLPGLVGILLLIFTASTFAGSWGVGGRGEPITPIPAPPVFDPAKVALGARLFSDPRLSSDGTVSCASCHDLAHGGADGRRHSLGVGQIEGDVNAPTIFNSVLNFAQFWDGRAATLEDQIDGSIHNPKEMDSSWEEIAVRLSAAPDVAAAFAAVYPTGVQPDTVKEAIVTFERTLQTPNSRFDRYLLGDRSAITEDETAGYSLFKSYGCVACHQGVNVGGNMFETFGVMGDYFADRGSETPADQGRFNVTGKPADRHRFRVPSLRLAVLTPPYFHDGTAATIERAVEVMARYQLGREMPTEDRDLIVVFLRTLPGEWLGQPLLAEIDR